MTRARKWLVGIAAAVGVLVVVLVALVAWVLYTPSGLRFALDRGVAMMHGQFTYARASGTLAGRATLDGIRYRDAAGDGVTVKRASVDLRPWALLGGRLHIARARIDGLALALAPPQPASTTGGFSLQPPMTIVLNDTELTHIDIRRAGRPLFAADSLALAGLWSRRQVVVRQLALRAPAGSVDLEGTLAVARGHRGRGTAKFDWTQDGTRYAGDLSSESDGKVARLTATLSAPTRIDAAATLQLDPAHAWTLALKVPRFDARALPALPATLRTLALDVRGSGNAHGGALTGSVTANDTTLLLDPARFRYDGKTLAFDPLQLRSPHIPGTATITGSVQLGASPMTATLDAAWTGVTLPADLVGQALATHGKLHIEGSTERFAVKGALAAGPPGRLSDLDVDLAGTPRSIDLHALKVVQKHGGLDVRGTIDLQPNKAWKLDAVARRFDPGVILAGWNGALDFRLATDGTLTADGPRGTLKLDRVAGTLRGRSIAGSRADITIAPDNLIDGSALLVSGNSRLEVVGKSGRRTDATITLDVASLNDWLPDAAGSLHGQFTARGKWPKLAVAGQLHGKGLRSGARSVGTLELTASVPDISQPGGDLDLTLGGVEASGLEFQDVHLRGSGNAASHHLQLDARGTQLSAALALAGNWQAKTRRWTGTLTHVELAPHAMPAWHQQAPSTITWQNGALAMSQLCLSAGEPRLCVSADRTAKGALTARYSLQHLPLQLLATLIGGANPLQATGEISGSGQLGMSAGGALAGHAELGASAGQVAYAANPATALLAWTSLGVTIDASGQDQHLHLRLHGALSDGGHVTGDVTVSGAQHALAGSIDADLRSLAFLEALSPEIANVQGTLGGSLQLSGTLAAPAFQGRIATSNFSAELPRAGLKLHDGRFAIAGDASGRLTITGQIASGKGILHVDGSAGFAADAPLSIDLKGNDVLVADIPAAHVIASPDLHIARANGEFALTGSVSIPTASIAVEKLPGQGPIHASPDVVIVDEPERAQAAPLAMRADLDVKLGDDVKVKGYGFDGKVHGQLAVQVRPGQVATGRGEISVTGKYQAYGQNLTIEQGRVLFAGTRLDNPGLDIRATRTIRSADVTAGLQIRGTAQHPVLTVFSDPTMEQTEALSYLVTGRPLDQLKSGEGSTLGAAAQALGGLAGNRIGKAIGARLGIEAGVSSSDALGGSAFTAGKYLSPRLFLSYGVGLFTPGQVITLRYTINRFLQFEAENATTGNRASLNYKIEK